MSDIKFKCRAILQRGSEGRAYQCLTMSIPKDYTCICVIRIPVHQESLTPHVIYANATPEANVRSSKK